MREAQLVSSKHVRINRQVVRAGLINPYRMEWQSPWDRYGVPLGRCPPARTVVGAASVTKMALCGAKVFGLRGTCGDLLYQAAT